MRRSEEGHSGEEGQEENLNTTHDDLYFDSYGHSSRDCTHHQQEEETAKDGDPTLGRGEIVAKEAQDAGPRGKGRNDHEDQGRDENGPAGEISENGVEGPAHPGVGGAGALVVAAQVTKGKDDAEHGNAAVEQGCGATEGHGAKEGRGGGSDGVRRCGARNAHDDGVKETEYSTSQALFLRTGLVADSVRHGHLFRYGDITFKNLLD